MALQNPAVGRPIERVEDPRLLRGRGCYVDDHSRPRQLHAAVLRSQVGHGRLLKVDTSAALAMPHVHAVYIAKDLGDFVPRIPVRLFQLPQHEPYQQPVIADGRVRYIGEPIAVVVADTPALAEDALDAIVVAIDPLSAVCGSGPARSGDELLFEGTKSNCAIRYRAFKGEPAQAFEHAPYVRKETFYVHRHTGITMEARGVLAEWNNSEEVMTVWGACKVPFANRRILAKLMDLDEQAVIMIEGDSGGSFGVRGEFFPEDYLIPFAAKRLGRPVKWIEDRREHFMAISHARDVRCELEVACETDGRILGMRGRAWVDVGAYLRTAGLIAPRNVGQFVSGPYMIENVEIDVFVQMSNKSPSGTYRGPGRYEGDFFRERLFDLSANDLGIDRVAFRRRNLVPESRMPYALPSIEPAPSPTSLDSGAYEHVLDLCLDKVKWAEKADLQGKLIDGRYHGLAVGCFVEGGAAGPSENAKLETAPDGFLDVYVGSSAVGQGVQTVLGQIAADSMELDHSRIRVHHGSTTYVKEGWGSYHSRSTVMGGSAILAAANELRTKLRNFGAKRFNCASDDVVLVDDALKAPDGRVLRWSELPAEDSSAECTFFNHKHTYAYGTHAAHVAVDPKTGHVEVLDYVAVEDAGRIVNPLTLHGQAIGAIVQGLGGTLLEEFLYDEHGQLLNASFADYLLPLCTDFPSVRATCLELRPSPFNPLGVKGAGEGGTIPVGGVIANAVASALSSLNVEPRELPLSPPRVWQLIQNARETGR